MLCLRLRFFIYFSLIFEKINVGTNHFDKYTSDVKTPRRQKFLPP
jgi:hypothetical protein